MAAPPSVLTPSQLYAFLSYIDLPAHLQTQRYTGNPTTDLHFLTQLYIHTISRLPYENLWIHYSPTHLNSIAPETNFTNIVTHNRGRGGYCFQVNILFNHVLRLLDFPAYLAPVRMRKRIDGVPQGAYSGWVHVTNIVTISNTQRYSLDVGFGSDGPTAPIALCHNVPQTNLGTQEIRLWRDWIPMQLHRSEASKLWIYQFRNSADAEWNSFHAFDETEAMEEDFGHLNWWAGGHPVTSQTFCCIVVKFLRRSITTTFEKGGDQEIYGKRMLINGVVKENLGGKTRLVEDCRTEEQRIKALETWFGIALTEEEKSGIKGWGTELLGNGSEGVVARQAKGWREGWEVTRGKDWSFVYKGPA